jgi:threonine dehydrogenase-like Zn-dependent dehydrogenase
VWCPPPSRAGTASPCKKGFFSQCDRANPNGPEAGPAFYGGPELSGPFHGLQAKRQRIALAHFNLVKLPEEVSDDQAILLSDIFPTGWFGASLADVAPGSSVAVFGCGPVGQFAIASALLRGAARVIAVYGKPDRLDHAREQGAECIDYEADDPVAAVKDLTDGTGVDAVIDAVGVDASAPRRADRETRKQMKGQVEQVAPERNLRGES